MEPIQKRFMVVCVLLILVLAVWFLVLVQEAKNKQAWHEKWMLDSDGNPINVRVEGRVWELGKGYRAATPEERRERE